MINWLGEQRIAGKLIARIGRNGQQLVAEFPELGILRASPPGDEVHFEPSIGADPIEVAKMRSSVLDALSRHIQGKITFHASAVSSGSNVVGFLGPSGFGKSTLVAALCQSGPFDLVADDTLAIEFEESESPGEAVRVVPTQSLAWLLPDARRLIGLDSREQNKIPIEFRRTSSDRLSLRALVGLDFDDRALNPSLRRLRGQNALPLLSMSLIRWIIDDPSAHLHEFKQLRRLVETCPVFEFQRKREPSGLVRSVNMMQELFESCCS
jgi:hypothetical protein